MIRSRHLIGAGGILLAVVGIGLTFAPGLAIGLTTNEAVVMVLAVFALGQATRVLLHRSASRTITTPTPERRMGFRIPGANVDADLQTLDPTVRERVKASVTTALERFQTRIDGSRTRVRQQLEAGSWTEDDLAAAFLTHDVESAGLRRPTWLGGEPLVRRQAIAAIDALAALVHDRSPGFDHTDREAIDECQHRDGATAGDADDVAATGTGPELHETGRWYGMAAITLATLATALFVQQPALLIVTAIGVALTGYGAFGRAGSTDPIDLTIERTLSNETPARGEDVTVHVRVRNDGEHTLPDVRLIDGVPAELRVTDGTARHAASLGPGSETTFTYTLEAEFGQHTFTPAFVIVRDLTGERQRIIRISGAEPSLLCHPPPEVVEGVSLRELTTGFAGQLPATEGRSGVKFHDKRQYQRGDPISLIDWKSLARTGELTTLRFEEEEMADVVVVIDARPASNLAASESARPTMARSVEAADVIVSSVLDANNNVGIGALSTEQCWLQPGRGKEHRGRARQLLATHPAFDSTASSDSYVFSSQANWLRGRLSSTTQVILLTPLCDDTILGFTKGLEASGTPTTVISPDPTIATTPGTLLARIDRFLRISALRDAGVPVYEWGRDESLQLALERGDRIHT